jgi:hypothetical protein
MRKKYLRFGLIFLILFPLLVLVYRFIFNGHHADWELHKSYYWLFKKENQENIDSDFSFVQKTKKDNYVMIPYFCNKSLDTTIYFSIWDIKDLKLNTLSKIKFKNVKSGVLDNFDDGELLNEDSYFEVFYRSRYEFDKNISLRVPSYDSIKTIFKGEKFVGCFGNFRQFAFWDKEDKIKCFNEFESPSIAVIFYKIKDKVLIIAAKSSYSFELDEIINILNIGKITKINFQKKKIFS